MKCPRFPRWICLLAVLAGSGPSLGAGESQPVVCNSSYRGWESLCLSNGLVELQVLPNIGGRIIQFKLGGKEFLWVNPQLAGKLPPPSGLAADGGWFNAGGDKLWPAPQGWDNDQQWPGPPDAVLDGQPYALERIPGKRGAAAIRLTSGKDQRSGIQFSRVVRIYEGTTRVSFDATMKNIDTRPRRWGIWAHTQLDGGKADGSGHNPLLQAWCPLNPQSHFPKGYAVIFGAPDNPSFQPDAQPGLMRVQYQYQVGKIGLDSRAGWVATADGESGAVFVQRFGFEPGKDYPDGSSVEFWLNGAGQIHAYNRDMVMSTNSTENPYVFESEVLSPFAQLKPGKSYTWHYDWYACNLGGNFPVVGCNDSGVIAEPLRASRTSTGWRLTGRFGVFAPTIPRIEWRDSHRHALGTSQLSRSATPLKPLVLDEALSAPPGACVAALIAGGELARIELPTAQVPGQRPTAKATGREIQWIEAEHYAEQRGSGAAQFAMPGASGGACVDNGWGGSEGDFLRYKLDLATDCPALHVTLAYAREPAGDSILRITLDGDTNRSALVKLHPTGDWGFKPDGWSYAGVQLPAGTKGVHTLEIQSLANNNNVNLDGFYLSAEPLDTTPASLEPPFGPEAVASIGAGLFALPCRTPVALPYSRRKAFVAGDGLLQSLLSTPTPRGMGGNIPGPGLQVKLVDHGPWTSVEQTLLNSPVPTVLTRWKWPEVEMEQAVFAAAPEEQGFFMRVTVTNKTAMAHEFELVSLVRAAGTVEVADGQRLAAQGQPLLRMLPARKVTVSAHKSVLPGPLGSVRQLRHTLKLAAGASASFDLQFLGNGFSHDAACAAAAKVWRERLAPAAQLQLPNPKLQYAFDASLRQMLMLIESRPDHARVLKGLQNYYGANPYDTFQVSRALDAVGLRVDAEELLRHQIKRAFDAIPPADPAAVKTLRFLGTNLYGGLHLNLGYSRGVWPYLSAEVALWHLRLGETEEAWRILRAMVDRASSTACWYEEIDHQPPRGHGDPADVWAAAEMVYLSRQLVLAGQAKVMNNK